MLKKKRDKQGSCQSEIPPFLHLTICALGPRFVLVLGFGGQVRIMWIAFITDEPKPNLTLVCPSSVSHKVFKRHVAPLFQIVSTLVSATQIECSHLSRCGSQCQNVGVSLARDIAFRRHSSIDVMQQHTLLKTFAQLVEHVSCVHVLES